MSLDEGHERVEGYPPEYRAYVRQTRASLVRSLLISGGTVLFLGWGYVHDLPPSLLFSMAPLASLVFLLLLLSTPGTLDGIRVIAVLPYFQ